MADMKLEDGTGSEVLEDATAELQALAQWYASATDPATAGFSEPYMWWIDKGNNLVKQRNADDTAWVSKGKLLSDGTVSWDGVASFRNKAINGDFLINQDGVGGNLTSGTVTLAAGTYGHDMWKAGSNGCTYQFATTENEVLITITAGTLMQVIDGNILNTGTHILSWQGTSQGKIGTGAYSVSGIKGAVVGGENISIEFGIGTLSNVQFEKGTVPTPFEKRDDELTRCRKYYEKSYPYGIAPGAITRAGCIFCNAYPGIINRIPVKFQIYKFTAPHCKIYATEEGSSGKWNQWGTGGLIGTVDGIVAIDVSYDGIPRVEGQVGSTSNYISFHWVADARP